MPPPLNIHVGTIASADSVLRGRQVFAQAFDEYRILGIEMEGGGVSEAAASCIIIKAATDYADTHKNKHFRGYAAATAASVTMAVLEKLIPACT
jgi:nucleoside phosphorylase